MSRTIDDLAAAIGAGLAEARRRLAAGEAVDLGDLARQVGGLVDAMAGLPDTAKPVLRRRLVALLEELEATEAAIHGALESCRTEMTQGDLSRRAVTAYSGREKT